MLTQQCDCYSCMFYPDSNQVPTYCHLNINIYEPVNEISNNVVCDQQMLRSACAYAQSDQSLCKSLEYSMSVKLLTEHYWEFLSLKGGCTGSCESTYVKMPHCWISHFAPHILFFPVYHNAHFKSCHVKTHVHTTCEP